MAETTLADILKDFSKVKIKRASVKIPKLRMKKEKTIKPKKEDKIPLSSIINILIKTAVEKAKEEKKEKKHIKDDRRYTISKESKTTSLGGYGAVSKGYDIAPHASYTDYGKLFSYLGKFRAKNAFENIGDAQVSNSIEGRGFSLIDTETMEKGARYAKYFSKGADMYTAALSLVPIAGMNSAEWEQFKLLMQLDKVTYLLKTSTS